MKLSNDTVPEILMFSMFSGSRLYGFIHLRPPLFDQPFLSEAWAQMQMFDDGGKDSWSRGEIETVAHQAFLTVTPRTLAQSPARPRIHGPANLMPAKQMNAIYAFQSQVLKRQRFSPTFLDNEDANDYLEVCICHCMNLQYHN